MPIKHIVLSGGGSSGFILLGCLQQLEKEGIFNMREIESIYGTSVGGIVAAVLSLGYDWETITDYFIKRPWNHDIHIDVKTVFDAYNKCGIYDKTFFDIMFKPLLAAKDIPMGVTLQQIFERSHIDLHFFTLEINQYTMEDISHSTHPDLPLLTAVRMTSGFPVIFAPVFLEKKCYVDGGIRMNYPLMPCIEQKTNQGNTTEILGLRNVYNILEDKYKLTEESNLLDYISNYLYRATMFISSEHTQPKIENEVSIKIAKLTSIQTIQTMLNEEKERVDLFNIGKQCSAAFVESRKNAPPVVHKVEKEKGKVLQDPVALDI